MLVPGRRWAELALHASSRGRCPWHPWEERKELRRACRDRPWRSRRTFVALSGDRPWEEESQELRRSPSSSRAPLVPVGLSWGISARLARGPLVLRLVYDSSPLLRRQWGVLTQNLHPTSSTQQAEQASFTREKIPRRASQFSLKINKRQGS
jgi:hypothetical protein